MTIIIMIIAHHFIVSAIIKRTGLKKGFRWFLIGGFMVSVYKRLFKLINFVFSSLINGLIKLKRKIA